MSKFKHLLVIATFLTLNSNSSAAVINEQAVLNAKNETLFKVSIASNQIEILNRHQNTKPTLKLSLNGAKIDQIENVGNTTNWKLHLNDNKISSVDFNLTEKNLNVTEYTFLWHGGGSNETRELCFHYGQGHWYNAYQSQNASWPMNAAKNCSTQQFNYLFDYDRYRDKISNRETILILEHLFVNSNGFAILLDQNAPWFIRRSSVNAHAQNDPVLCFLVNNSIPFMSQNMDPSYLDIKIRILASTNPRILVNYIHRNLIQKPLEFHNEKLFKNPIWFTEGLTDSFGKEEIAFSNEISKNHFPNQSLIVYHFWDSAQLDELMKLDVFPTENVISTLKSHGFEIGIQLLKPNLNKHKFIEQFTVNSTNFIDFSVQEACKFYLTELNYLRYQKRIDSLMLSAIYNGLHVFEFADPTFRQYPNLYTTKYIETVSQVPNTTIISEYGFKSQHLPVWVRLTNHVKTPYDQLLRELIPNVLSVSLGGYSLIVPYSAGGTDDAPDDHPTEELFIRMVQATTLMPSMSFSKKPWKFSAKTLEITKKFVNLHTEHAHTIIELAKKRITDGSPIIRPLWYVAPDDPKTYSIGDQYMLGEDILVAPVVRVGQTERTVYLITGTWIDQHGKSYQGPGEFKVAAPLEELPYFKRKL